MADKLNFATRKQNSEAGFSLIELLISMVVFLIFISAVYGLLRIANIQKSTVNSQTEVMVNLRVPLNMIGRDAVNAGLGYSRVGGNIPDNLTNARMGLPADTDSNQDLLTAVIAGDNVNTNNFLPVGQKTDVVAFAYRDMTFNNGNPITITGASSIGTGGVVATTQPGVALAVNNSATPFDLYLISNGTRSAVALATGRPDNNSLRFETGSADILGVNLPYTGPINSRSLMFNCADQAVGSPDPCMNYPNPSPVSAKKIIWVSYQVTPDGTLTRTTYGNNSGGTAVDQIQIQPLAYNIQNLQVRYLLRDGTSSQNPSNNGANQNVLNNVVQVEVTISARISVQESGASFLEKSVATSRLFDSTCA